MNVINSLSLWVILATVIPGFITITCLLLIVKWVYALPGIDAGSTGDLELTAYAIAVMLITQMAGMLHEKIMIRVYARRSKKITVADYPFAGELELDTASFDALREYRQLYLVLAAFRSSDDSHGHVERTAAQFFMSNNIQAAFALSLLVLVFMPAVVPYTPRVLPAAGALLVLYLLTFFTTRTRFRTMCNSIWVARQLLLRERKRNGAN